MYSLDDIERLVSQGYARVLLEQGYGPAIMAVGQTCAQCGAAAWQIHAIPFCLDHGQESLAKSECRRLGLSPE